MRLKLSLFLLFGNLGPVRGCCLKRYFQRMLLTVIVLCVTFSFTWFQTGLYVCECDGFTCLWFMQQNLEMGSVLESSRENITCRWPCNFL